LSLSKRRIESKKAPRPIGPYSQAVVAGSLLFASGQIPVDPETSELVLGSIEAQTEQVLKNLIAVLKEAKLGPQNVVKTTVYLTDLADFSAMNTVYERYLGKEAPARSTIQAAALPRGAKVEIELVAAF
jgi:2-iminobutanoate/2-iminopropanoate deaminase